jgi:hypothetical protein
MELRAAAFALVAAVSLNASVCKRKSDESSQDAPPPAPTLMPSVTWTEHEGKIGETGAKIRSNVFDLDWTISFDKLPKGSRVHVGDKEALADESGSATVKIPMAETIGALSPKDAFDHTFKVDPKLTIEISFPNAIKVATSVPPTAVNFGVAKAFETLKDKPVLFGAEPPGNPEKHTVVMATHVTPEALGPAATMRDVDWVALTDPQPERRGKMCTGYKDKSGAPTVSLQMEMVDWIVTIYERKTAKAIEKKKFAASETCPMLAMFGKANTYPNDADIKKWLRERRDAK